MDKPVCPTPHKAKHATRSSARREARRLRELDKNPRGRIAPYLCSCGSYHVGTRPLWAETRAELREKTVDDAA